jgi:uncharacterized protein (TIGR02246 family)
MKIYLLVIVSLFLFSAFSNAQTDAKRAEDEKAIRQIVTNMSDTWAAGDAEKFADLFSDDVDYTVWNGLYFNGREANVRGHRQIFDTVYKGSKITPEVRKIRFLGETVAVVHLISGNERNGKQLEGLPRVSPMMVVSKESGKWLIVAFQNTPILDDYEVVYSRKDKKK